MTYDTTILANTPQAYYRLNESSGTVVHDSSGNGYDGKLTGVTAYSQSGAITGDSDTSIAFSSSGGLSLPYTLKDYTFTAISIEFWINLTGWNYVVVTCDNTTTLVYLNGILFSVGSGASSIDISSLFDVAGSGTPGLLAKVAIYNYVLSSVQVAADYAASSPSAPHALFPTIARRMAILPVNIRRSGSFPTALYRVGIYPSGMRRAGAYAPAVRRDGTILARRRSGGMFARARRTGDMALAVRRSGALPARARRTGDMPVTAYRNGTLSVATYRDGTFPSATYRAGSIPALRRDGTITTPRRTGETTPTSRRQS